MLDDFLKVNSKVLDFKTGNDVLEGTEELCRHFEQEGTPVMIGGGVLA